MIDWNKMKKISRFEHDLIDQIANRAVDAAKRFGVEYKKATAMMDLEVVHCCCCQLRLDELKNADDANFAHDIFGIRRHLDRETGQLAGGFLPRYAMT